MKYAETALLVAVRNRLREVGGFADDACAVEFDEMAPAKTGDVYLAVLPGGWSPGPRHNTSGGVNDLLYSVDVVVIRRIRQVPRDRLRNVFLDHLGGLNETIDIVYPIIDFSYPLLRAANTLIQSATGENDGYDGGFIEPLKFSGVDRRPKQYDGSMFGASSQQPGVALGRTISFSGARRITTK